MRRGSGGCHFAPGGQVGLITKVVCEQSHEEGEGWGHVAALGKSVPGREKNRHEAPWQAPPGASRGSRGRVGRVVSMGETRREARRKGVRVCEAHEGA